LLRLRGQDQDIADISLIKQNEGVMSRDVVAVILADGFGRSSTRIFDLSSQRRCQRTPEPKEWLDR
jgi:hypothetical protein